MTAQITEAPKKHSIEKVRLDFFSTKHQMVLGALLIVASCCLAYGGTLKMGFLLDDYLHLDYAARALRGDLGPLLSNFTSNWGGSDIMKSYRPVISFSIFFDYLLYHIHAFGFHLTNLIAFCACSLMVALVTQELTGRLGSRSGALAAIWAGLLFSVYPLHAESVAWVIGRVDTVATVFYLASLYCFLRLELLGEKVYLWRSLVFFLLSLTSKEIAVSLPFAVTLLAFLPPGRLDPGREVLFNGGRRLLVPGIKRAAIASAPFWLVLGLYAIFRQCLLGTAVGGYGGGGLSDLFHSLKIFADKESLIKIFVPVSEEYLPVRALAGYCVAPVVLIAAGFLVRQLLQFARGARQFAAIILPLSVIVWLAVALVPAFQIWHIYPNLVGSRLFFLSSAGLCITLVLLALPAAEPLKGKAFYWFCLPGLVALSALYLVWFDALKIDLRAWKEASALVDTFESELRKLAMTDEKAHLVVLNLPQDYKGAGMFGRKLYLDIANRPPFLGADIGPRLTVIEPKITGNRDYIWPRELTAAIKAAGPTNIYIWSNKEAALSQFHPGGWGDETTGYANMGWDFEAGLSKLPGLKSESWQAVDEGAAIVKRSGSKGEWCEITSAAIETGDNTVQSKVLVVKLPAAVDPLNASNWLLALDVEGSQQSNSGLTSHCKAIWHGQDSEKPLGEATAFFDRQHGQYLFYLGRYRSYLLSQKPVNLILQFTPAVGAEKFKPSSLRLTSEKEYSPVLSITPEGKAINFDASGALNNAGAQSNRGAAKYSEIRFFLTAAGTTVDPNTVLDLYRPAFLENAVPVLSMPISAQNSQGAVTIASLMAGTGTTDYQNGPPRQIVAVLASKDGKVVSLSSQPVTIGSAGVSQHR